jgi:hypothetical protein
MQPKKITAVAFRHLRDSRGPGGFGNAHVR